MGCGRVAVRYWFSLKEVKTECTFGCWSWRMPSNKAYCLKQGVSHVSSLLCFWTFCFRAWTGVSTCFDKRWVNKDVFFGKASVAPVCSWTFFMSTRSHMAASSFGYRHCESLTAADLPLVSNWLEEAQTFAFMQTKWCKVWIKATFETGDTLATWHMAVKTRHADILATVTSD